MFVIGIDPHKRSHTAAVLDDSEELVGQALPGRASAERQICLPRGSGTCQR